MGRPSMKPLFKQGRVYINGGPQNEDTQGLPDGTYYFQVTNPSGAVLLSTILQFAA